MQKAVCRSVCVGEASAIVSPPDRKVSATLGLECVVSVELGRDAWRFRISISTGSCLLESMSARWPRSAHALGGSNTGSTS